MTRIISIVGHGGTGKTTIAINTALGLRMLKNTVALADFNVHAPHVGAYMNTSPPKTLNNFLSGVATMEDVAYRHSSGITLLLSSLKTDEFADIRGKDHKNIRDIIKRELSNHDFVVIDTPDVFMDAECLIKASDDVVVVSSPNVGSVVEAGRYVQSIRNFETQNRIAGIILNGVAGKKHEISNADVAAFAEAPLIGVIHEDDDIARSTNARLPLLLNKPGSKSGKIFLEIAARLDRSTSKHGLGGIYI